MKHEKILHAIGKISDELIEDAALPAGSGRKQFPWKRVIALAACLCVILTATFAIPYFRQDTPAEPTYSDQISFLSELHKTDPGITGQPFRYIAGSANPGTGPQAEAAPPEFVFQQGYVHVIAKAVEELGIYETMPAYGDIFTSKYRLFSMQVIDPLESELEGTFYYLLPEKLQGDLTQYDALLISMSQLPKNYVLRSGNQLTAFDYLFHDPQDTPELGNIIAFTDGVFDESLWQDESWHFGYQFAKYDLDEEDNDMLVLRGTTLEEALLRRQEQYEERAEWAEQHQWGDWTKNSRVRRYDFRTEAARQLMAYLKPFENGIFIPESWSSPYHIRRYINGCPTNEWYAIDHEEETVTSSAYRFTDEDFEKLPNISAYIASLDLSRIGPQHTDTSGKELIYNHVVGWYEKTESGIYSVVRIAWRYCDQGDRHVQYYDESFILLDETGDHLISREDLLALIGENRNISEQEYGVRIAVPV